MQHWPAPHPAHPVEGSLRLPGSKSLTNRYLVLAALANGPSTLREPLKSRDTDLMIGALRSLGAVIEEVPGEGSFGPDLLVRPTPRAASGDTEVDCGLAGTVMRFVPVLAALRSGRTRFIGDAQARVRPMNPVLDSLRAMGVRLESSEDSTLPFSILGTGNVTGGPVTINAGASSQFVSAMLLAGARFDDGLTLEHDGDTVPSPEHIAMTVDVLRSVGVDIDDSVSGRWKVFPGAIQAFDIHIEQDLSNAAPFLAAAVATRGRVQIPDWPVVTTQIGDRLRHLLVQLGSSVEFDGGTVTVTGGAEIQGGTFAATGELAPVIAALCALADTPSTLTGIAHLRGHETNRLAALTTEINGLGGDVEETADGLFIRPKRLHGGVFHTYNDHRMAMAGAVLGLAIADIDIENIATTSKTIPGFADLWSELAAQASTTAGER
ncbi:3-phosphoshikimate 1-carboxyvinyltransferase [Arthrobacter roseus]|uniref:3-phosphoshikimate 1-carboxyvinyltransferase n=1 Tax=Arthrobacter roseus TaxID=136274 RepID=UPI001963CF93|nr:3-phosphoshikimate 1-carboxyvinyltransferase [Arthrobacter roseus]